jgi:glycosyltransferase 2 family protein
MRSGGLGRTLLRRLPLIGTALGLILAGWLVATNDLGAVVDAFAHIGVLGLAGLVVVRVVVIALCGSAWALVLRGLAPPALAPYLLLRLVREGINVLLPVASVGGEAVGGRLLTFFGVGGGLAAASILVDMLFQAGSQALFAALGVALLSQVEGATAAALSAWFLKGLAVSAVALGGFLLAQRLGAARALERRISALARRWAEDAGEAPGGAGAASGPGVQAALDAIWARGRAGPLAGGFLLHLLAWLLGAAEIAIALACLGLPFTLAQVLLIESLSQAIKSAAFPVPSGLGVQEGGFVVLGALYGLDPGTALALSLAKRVPDIVLGIPALLAWQALEARRFDVAGVSRTPPRPEGC